MRAEIAGALLTARRWIGNVHRAPTMRKGAIASTDKVVLNSTTARRKSL
jgi:hypothetical protein